MESKDVNEFNMESLNIEVKENEEVKKKSFMSKYKIDILLIGVFIIVAYIVSSNYSLLLIQGSSMSPTYSDKDILVLKKENDFKKGDVVVFDSPESWSKEGKKFIKRIVATEGDTVTIGNESLLVNGEFVADISEKKCGLDEDINVGVDTGQFLLVGDNYSASNDSLTQFCNKNDNFLVDKNALVLSGKEILVIGGLSNE